MPEIIDEEFGVIAIRRSARATSVKIRIAPDGRLRASLPLYAPILMVKRLLKNSRSQLREMLTEHRGESTYENGMSIGKSHTLSIREVQSSRISARRHGQQIVVSVPGNTDVNSPANSRIIRDAIIEALRVEAKSYLPKRLSFLGDKYGFRYTKVRFSHASGRWGSCSSNGTISLNIALMKLPFELIDYVLIHELSHTREMNHSSAFWKLVESADEQYVKHRQLLKKENPSI